MNLILLRADELAGGRFEPEETDPRLHHIREVLKAREGDRLRAGVVSEGIGELEVVELTERRGVFAYVDTDRPPPPQLPLRLLLGHPRPIVLRRMLRDLSTIGVGEIRVFGTELGERSYLSSTIWAGSTVENLLSEGASQAGTTLLPRVTRETSAVDALGKLERSPTHGLRYLFDVDVGPTPVRANASEANASDANASDANAYDAPAPGELRSAGECISIAVGSERGFSTKERNLFYAAGFAGVRLGSRTLRTETAAVAAVSYVAGQFGLW